MSATVHSLPERPAEGRGFGRGEGPESGRGVVPHPESIGSWHQSLASLQGMVCGRFG